MSAASGCGTFPGEPMATLAQLHGWLPGARPVGDAATAIARVHTDTRTLAPGDLF
ncbi:MAG: UDP-N-acetylmuramoylalanyl-D-glutamyl-2,6-diaminopimelate--D-alanyl-D-alanine ligase, partial [Variovorax sp.]|nr:UDP-N-acetylmuramoylalanyl-D-glutamyl-2,6-diaminopimelate--D-alanyl-D-alanine ligase [Variovorax sp.]